MHDFTIEVFLWCPTNERWSTEINGSKGDKHHVSFYRGHWECDCLAFTRFRRNQHCKHILAAKELKCDWGSMAAAGSPDPTPADHKCPNCHRELVGVRVAV